MNPFAKWNSRLVAVTLSGISTLAALPDLPPDLRAVGIVVIASVGIIMIGLRDVLGRREALHDLGLDHPLPQSDIPEA